MNAEGTMVMKDLQEQEIGALFLGSVMTPCPSLRPMVRSMAEYRRVGCSLQSPEKHELSIRLIWQAEVVKLQLQRSV